MMLLGLVVLVLWHLSGIVCAYLLWCVVTNNVCFWNKKRVGITPKMATAYMWFCILQCLAAVVYLLAVLAIVD